MTDSIFGPVLDSSDVEAALLAHLKAWMPTTIAELVRQRDPTKKRWKKGIRPIKTYDVKHMAVEKWPESQLPMLLANSPGMVDDPVEEEDGVVSGVYAVILLAISSGANQVDAKALARLYSSAARIAIMQEPSLKAGTDTPFSDGVHMGQEANFPVTKGVEAERNLMAVSVPYFISVPQILNVRGGPLEPLDDPDEAPEPWPTVKPGGGSAQVEALRADGFFDGEEPPE